MSEELRKLATDFLFDYPHPLRIRDGDHKNEIVRVMAEFASQVCEQREKVKCGHPSLNGISVKREPGKVWKCDVCDGLFFWKELRPGFGEHVPATISDAIKELNEAAELALQAANREIGRLRNMISHDEVLWTMDLPNTLAEEVATHLTKTGPLNRYIFSDVKTPILAAIRKALQAKEQELAEMEKIKERMQHERDEAHDLAESVRYQEAKLKELFALCQASDPESSIAQLHEHFAGDKRLADTVHSLRTELAQARQQAIAALESWLEHHKGCAVQYRMGEYGTCDCGLDQRIRSLTPPPALTPTCIGYEGGCDGDLTGEPHEANCPKFAPPSQKEKP